MLDSEEGGQPTKKRRRCRGKKKRSLSDEVTEDSSANGSSGPAAQSKKVDKTKFKTEMCKNWLEYQYCRYEDKCQFAHGFDEIK